jgi:hypothetical protein
MPGLVKIGKTTQVAVQERIKQLFGTGVSVPFDCAFACQVKGANKVEAALHLAFGNNRINPNREFFKIEPERVIAVLRLLRVDEVTKKFEEDIEADVSSVDIQSAKNLKDARRPRMNFHEIGIPDGSLLVFTENPEITVKVISDRKVEYQGEENSLTSAIRAALSLPEDYALQPSPYWIFSGKRVKELYDQYHNSDE